MSALSHYTVLTTCPDYGSRNVGDQLIEIRLKELLEREKGDCQFLTLFREEPLDAHLEKIHATRAILMPACPVRDTPMHPGTYRLVDDLTRIRLPMIPVGANWNVYPGDAQSRREGAYSKPTVEFLHHLAGQVDRFSCREFHTQRILVKYGIKNTCFTGDPAMFHLPYLGRPFRRPTTVDRLVFSPPLSPYYTEQALHLLDSLAELFPTARRYCAFHLEDLETSTSKRSENSAAMTPEVTAKNSRLRHKARELGYEVRHLAGDVAKLKFYEECDLHVGYECHAHLYFLSCRLPSVLIAEDARGVGFNYTLGVGGFSGFERSTQPRRPERKTMTSGYCTSIDELATAPPRTDLDGEVVGFLREELETGFRRYTGLATFLDETYETGLRPFLQSLP